MSDSRPWEVGKGMEGRKRGRTGDKRETGSDGRVRVKMSLLLGI